MDLPDFENFPSRTFDKVRYSDVDRQGHVNNAVFTTYFETGRVAAVAEAGASLSSPGFSVVLVRICVDFRKEIFYPGTVEIGTAVKAIGRSSATFTQGLFQNGHCVATAESVLVQMDNATHRAAALNDETKLKLAGLIISSSKSE